MANPQRVVDAARDVLDKSYELSVREVESLTRDTEVVIRLNQQTMSFSERVILLNGATITLSLTLISAVASRGAHVPKAPFLLLVCPGWLLLLVSILCSWARMKALHNLNVFSYKATRAYVQEIEYGTLHAWLIRLSTAVEDAISTKHQAYEMLEPKRGTVMETLSTLAQERETWRKQREKLTADITQKLAEDIPLERVAFCSAVLGLLLLCAFVVKLVLTL